MIFPDRDFVLREAKAAVRAYFAPFSGIVESLRHFARPEPVRAPRARDKSPPLPPARAPIRVVRTRRTAGGLTIRSIVNGPHERAADATAPRPWPFLDWESGVICHPAPTAATPSELGEDSRAG
jgi:hypothetical protein